MAIKLRNGATTLDRRLDRIARYDERSREFPVRAIVDAKKPRSYTWRCVPRLDQGTEGACVGFGVGHELAARPAESRINGADCRRLYFVAQKIDEWPGGAYPGAKPFYEGTSVLSGIKIAQRLGYFDSYRWAFSFAEFLLGVSYAGPAVVGLQWRSGMFEPDADGMLHYSGRVEGGHCTLVNGVDVKRRRVRIHNSWGRSWGVDGEAFLSFDDMAAALANEGEACFAVGRRTVPLAATRSRSS